VRYKGEAELIKLLDHHKKVARENGKKYDCLVPVSGGKDSTYTLYRLVTRYDMRVLAFNYEHSFTNKQAKRNVEKAIKILGVDLIQNRDDRKQMQYLKHNLLALPSLPVQNIGRLSSLLCVGCEKGYVDKANEVAKNNGIVLIMQGGNPVEVDLRFFMPTQKKIEILKIMMKEIRDVLTNPIFYNLGYYWNIQFQMEFIGKALKKIKKHILKPILPRPKILRDHFFDYIPWKEDEVVSTLERELEWRRPEKRVTTTRFDCAIHSLVDTLRLRYMGTSDKDLMYSMMVRKRMLSRDEALNKAKVENEEEERLWESTLRDILMKFGELDKYDPMRTIWDKNHACI
jgi:hypothetical protein